MLFILTEVPIILEGKDPRANSVSQEKMLWAVYRNITLYPVARKWPNKQSLINTHDSQGAPLACHIMPHLLLLK